MAVHCLRDNIAQEGDSRTKFSSSVSSKSSAGVDTLNGRPFNVNVKEHISLSGHVEWQINSTVDEWGTRIKGAGAVYENWRPRPDEIPFSPGP